MESYLLSYVHLTINLENNLREIFEYKFSPKQNITGSKEPRKENVCNFLIKLVLKRKEKRYVQDGRTKCDICKFNNYVCLQKNNPK